VTSIFEIEESLKDYLQKNITICIDNKILKQGRLILFCIKDFFCVFTLVTDAKTNKKIIYELPYPFIFQKNSSNLIFDYTLNTFCNVNRDTCQKVEDLQLKKTSKLFNKKVSVYSL
jgi:hypothetical protein